MYQEIEDIINRMYKLNLQNIKVYLRARCGVELLQARERDHHRVSRVLWIGAPNSLYWEWREMWSSLLRLVRCDCLIKREKPRERERSKLSNCWSTHGLPGSLSELTGSVLSIVGGNGERNVWGSAMVYSLRSLYRSSERAERNRKK